MITRSQFSKTLAAILAAQGFRDTTPEMACEILDAWCEGIRGVLLPHGNVGIVGKPDSQ